MGSSEDPSLVNNVDELGLVYQGVKVSAMYQKTRILTRPLESTHASTLLKSVDTNNPFCTRQGNVRIT